ncbi:MAG: ATP-binding cassette domain-containing protein, partial [Egibacteraceae bacterium]
SSADARAEVARLLQRVRLAPDLADRYPRQLSGGERQRVAIARALAARPLALVCDEVTSALDVSVQADVLELLDELRRDLGLALVLISHDLGVVARLADRVLVLDDGRICEQGTAAAVLGHPTHYATRSLLTASRSLSDALATRTGPAPRSGRHAARVVAHVCPVPAVGRSRHDEGITT